jgi:hypothetical protein
VIPGVNRIFNHGGKDYHLQAEDLGPAQPCFEVRVYDGGAVLWRKKVAYEEILAQNLGVEERTEALRSMMEKTLHTVQAAIAKGKLG